MADLKNLSELVSHAEAAGVEIKELELRKEALNQECITLEARKTHAEEELRVSEQLLSRAKADHATFIATAKSESNEYAQVKKSHLAELERIKRDHTDTLASNAINISQQEEVLGRVNAEIETASQRLEMLNIDQAEKTRLIADLTGRVNDLSTEISSIEGQIEAKRAAAQGDVTDLSDTIGQLSQTLDTTKAELLEKTEALAKLLNAISRAKAQLEQSRIEHDNYVEYEKRATKALRAYEASILDREQKLQIDSRSARRRGSILDNLD